jgi:hypothetical protein
MRRRWIVSAGLMVLACLLIVLGFKAGKDARTHSGEPDRKPSILVNPDPDRNGIKYDKESSLRPDGTVEH